MKKRAYTLQKIIVFTVLIAVLCGTILTGTVIGTSSKEMTAGLFEAKLAGFIANVYANGSRYIDKEEEYSGIQCYGFANQLTKYIYGSFPCYYSGGTKPNKDWEINYGSAALQKLHVGDVVRYRSSVSADHSIVITGMDEEKVYFSDANNDHKNTVRHNAEMTWDKLLSRIDKSLEVDSKLTGWVAHYKYWNDEPAGEGAVTVCYNANGGVIETEKTADRYIVITSALRMRADAGLDKSIITNMRNGKFFDVAVGTETVEADGYTWAPITFEGEPGWAAISDPGDVRLFAPVMNTDYYTDTETGDILKNGTQEKYLQVLYGEDMKLEAPEKFGVKKEGLSFIGWSLTPDGKPVTSVAPSDDGEIITLYALWGDGDAVITEETTGEDTTAEETTEPETTEPETTEPETTEPETTEPETTEPETTEPETTEPETTEPETTEPETTEPETTEPETTEPETTEPETTEPETTEPETTEPETTEPETTEPETTAEETAPPEPPFLKGDINGDGRVNNKDVKILFQLLNDDDAILMPVCDVNEDGRMNNKDVTYLFRYLSEL